MKIGPKIALFYSLITMCGHYHGDERVLFVQLSLYQPSV